MRVDIGAARITRVSELDEWAFEPTELLPAWKQVHAAAARLSHPASLDEQGRIVLAIHTYVIDIGDHRIVVDPGNGDGKSRPVLLAHDDFATGHLDALAAAGVTPESVTEVVATHLHPDHCGAGTRRDGDSWVPAFPNAQYLAQGSDLDWLDDVAQSAQPGTVASDLVRMIDDSIRPVGGLLRRVDGGTVLADHAGTVVRIVPAPGHSPGHVVVRVEPQHGPGAVLSGDVIHHPLQLTAPELRSAGDVDGDVAAATRTRLLGDAARDGSLLLTAHFPAGSPTRLVDQPSGPAWAGPQ